MRNIDANCTTWLDCWRHFHIISRGFNELNNSWRPFPQTWSNQYLAIKWLRPSYSAVYPCYHTNNIGPTFCKLRGGGKPLQLAAILSRIHLKHNDHIGCNLFHSDKWLTIQSSGLATFSCYYLPLQFITSTSQTHNHLHLVREDTIPVDW